MRFSGTPGVVEPVSATDKGVAPKDDKRQPLLQLKARPNSAFAVALLMIDNATHGPDDVRFLPLASPKFAPGPTPPRGGRQRRSGGRDLVRSALHAACAIDRLQRREAASSVRSAAYCGRVRARSSISDGRPLARSRQSNGLKLWPNQSVLFRHPTNANSVAWQHLPKVLINRRYQIGRGVALRLRTQGPASAHACAVLKLLNSSIVEIFLL